MNQSNCGTGDWKLCKSETAKKLAVFWAEILTGQGGPGGIIIFVNK